MHLSCFHILDVIRVHSMLQYVLFKLQLFLSLVDPASVKYRRVLLGSVSCVNYSTVQRLRYANHDARNRLTIPISRSPQPISTSEANRARVNGMSIMKLTLRLVDCIVVSKSITAATMNPKSMLSFNFWTHQRMREHLLCAAGSRFTSRL